MVKKEMIILIFILVNSIYSLQEEEQISQCGSGVATYYEVNDQGNCGFGDIAGTIDTAAAPEYIYDGSNGCGICYEVIGELGSRIVMIADRCPGCDSVTTTGKIHLDLDERVFPYIDDKDKGRINTSIRMVPCKVTGNVKLIITETNNWYFNAYVYNYKIGVKSLQISLNGGKYEDVKRESHNRFVKSSISSLTSIKVKIISISGEELECYEDSNIIEGTYDCGKQFTVKNFYDLYSREIISKKEKSECCKKPSLISDISACIYGSDSSDSPVPDEGSDSGKSYSEILKISLISFLLIFDYFLF